MPAEISHFLYEKETLCQRASTVSGLIPSLLRSLYLFPRLANRTSSLQLFLWLLLYSLAPFFFRAFLACVCYLQYSLLNSLFTKQQLRNYGYKACAEITCSSWSMFTSMTDRQHPHSHHNIGAHCTRPNKYNLCIALPFMCGSLRLTSIIVQVHVQGIHYHRCVFRTASRLRLCAVTVIQGL